MIRNPRTEKILDELLKSRKYGQLAQQALARIAGEACRNHRSDKDALKSAKRKLHQAYGAYFDPQKLKAIDAALEIIEADPSTAGENCRAILSAHASTAERLPIIETFYSKVFAMTGRPSTVLDLGCGLNAFALPWMGLSTECRYTGIELDARLVKRTHRFLKIMGQPHDVREGDLISEPGGFRADIVFVLKVAPCLEQQSPGAFLRLMHAIRSEWTVVTFPIASLGGRNVGMKEHYRNQISESGIPAPYEIVEFESELAFIFRATRHQMLL